jgi:hypothetical protein
MRLSTAPKAILEKAKRLLLDTGKIRQLATDPKLSQSYYPSEKRKSKPRILADLLLWRLRHGEVNTFYYAYGFDRQHGVNTEDYLPYRAFRKIRDQRNHRPKIKGDNYNYVCMLQDKFVFSQFLSSLGFPTPKNLAICDRASITWLDQMRTVPLEELLQDKTRHFDGFCKRLAGIQGKGVFPLKLSDGKLFVKSEEIDLDELRNRLDRPHLIQERIQQHEKMSSLHPHSVNTIRLVTFNNDGKVQVLSATQRIGTHGRSQDNWAAGGIIVRIDLATGRLHDEGLFKPGYGGRVREHPQTHVSFSGFEIPYFHDAVKLATKLHEYLYGIHSIGWDIAIAETGPVIIEGNDDWDGVIPMVLEKDFKQRFLEMYRS